MSPSDPPVVRSVTHEDEPALHPPAGRDRRPTLTGGALLGTVGGRPAGSLIDGRLVADPFSPTGQLASRLRRHRLPGSSAGAPLF